MNTIDPINGPNRVIFITSADMATCARDLDDARLLTLCTTTPTALLSWAQLCAYQAALHAEYVHRFGQVAPGAFSALPPTSPTSLPDLSGWLNTHGLIESRYRFALGEAWRLDPVPPTWTKRSPPTWAKGFLCMRAA